MHNVDVVLMEPENPGNVGSVARVLNNFGFNQLVLVNPCELTEETRAHAKHAYNIIKNARLLKMFNPQIYDYIVGTTGIVGSERHCVTPQDLRTLVPAKSKIAILFGNEGRGLSKKELELCDVLVHIPTASAYAVMNLSHAAAIVLYEVSARATTDAAAPRKMREELERTFINALENLEFADSDRAVKAFARTINRVPPSRAEATVLLGAFKKLATNTAKRKK